MKRTDIHRPSAIQPSEYSFVAFDYLGGSDLDVLRMLGTERQRVQTHMKMTNGKWAQHEHGGTCYVCGAFAIYLAIWYHQPSNSYIKTGEDCAQKMDMSYSEDDFNRFRRVIGDARETQAGKKKAQTVLADNGLSRAWDIYTFGRDANDQPWTAEEATALDAGI